MPRPFALPDLGEGLTEAEIVKVLVNEGDVLAEDAPLLEVETDKATVEIPSPFAGRVARVHVQPGQTVKVGDVLVTFEDSAGVAESPSVWSFETRAKNTGIYGHSDGKHADGVLLKSIMNSLCIVYGKPKSMQFVF